MISIPGKFTHILHFKRVGIIATAFGKTQNSKGEIFAAVAFVSAKAPYAHSPSLSSLSALSTSEKYQFRFPSVILYQLFGCNLGFAEGNILQKNWSVRLFSQVPFLDLTWQRTLARWLWKCAQRYTRNNLKEKTLLINSCVRRYMITNSALKGATIHVEGAVHTILYWL